MTVVRTSVEKAIEQLFENQERGVPISLNQISKDLNISWRLAERATRIILDLQDFCDAYELQIIELPQRKILNLELRVRMNKLPRLVADWFIQSEFFKIDKHDFTREKVRKLVVKKEHQRTSLEDSLKRVTKALELCDEITISELSKRTAISRKAVERVLDLILNNQDRLSNLKLIAMSDEFVIEQRRDLYELGEAQMRFVLEKRYLSTERDIPKSKERILMNI
jgi:hypothetical protein